jgi:hypothetical protein
LARNDQLSLAAANARAQAQDAQKTPSLDRPRIDQQLSAGSVGGGWIASIDLLLLPPVLHYCLLMRENYWLITD